MDQALKFFVAAFVGWLWTMTATTMDVSLTAFFHYFSFTAIDGLVDFLKHIMVFMGWLAVVYFGWFAMSSAWKSK